MSSLHQCHVSHILSLKHGELPESDSFLSELKNMLNIIIKYAQEFFYILNIEYEYCKCSKSLLTSGANLYRTNTTQ